MCAEAVILDHTAPVGIDHLFALLLWPDSVHPVILVCKAAAWPAKDRNLDLSECIYDILSHAIDIGNVRVFTDIDSLVDAATQMLRKMSVDFLIDSVFFMRSVDVIFCHDFILFHESKDCSALQGPGCHTLDQVLLEEKIYSENWDNPEHGAGNQ